MKPISILKNDLRFLQLIYTNIDDEDGMIGGSNIRMDTPSLIERIQDYESQRKWNEALTCYEQALQINANNILHHQGLVKCLHNLGHLRTAIIHINGCNHIEQANTLLAAQGVAASWRLGQWDLVDQFYNLTSNKSNFEVGLGQILNLLHLNNLELYQIQLNYTRKNIISQLSAASRESYQRAHPYFIYLHILQEIEQFRELFGLPIEFITKKKQQNEPKQQVLLNLKIKKLVDEFDQRLNRCQPSFRIRETILSARKQLFNEYHMYNQVANTWLLISKEARYAKQYDIAAGAVLQVQRINNPPKHLIIEQAKLFYETNRLYDAISYLKKYITNQQPASSSSDHDLLTNNTSSNNDDILAQIYLLMGQWMQESGVKEGKDILSLYNHAINKKNWDQAHFLIAKYYEKLFYANKANDHHPNNKAPQAMNMLNIEQIKLLYHIINQYGSSLSYSSRYIFQSLPRLLTLWLDYGQLWTNNCNINIKKLYENCHQLTLNLVNKLAAYIWLTALPQIISRISHHNISIFNFLELIIIKIFKSYPQQTLWILAGVMKSKNSIRKLRIKQIMQKILLQISQYKHIIQQGIKLFDALVEVCELKISSSSRNTTLSIKKYIPKLALLKDINIIVPLQSAMTITLPATAISGTGIDTGANISDMKNQQQQQ